MTKDIQLLVLDDDEDILRSLEHIFSNEPFGVFATTNPHEAMKVLESRNIKVVMTDQRMPDVTGVDFLKTVKTIKPNILRILFTGYADLRIAEEAVNQGEIYRLIYKPWNPDELRKTVRDAMRHYDLETAYVKLLEVHQVQNEQLKAVNETLQKLNENQKEFIHVLSHEIRTPLTAVKMGIDMVLCGVKGEITRDQSYCLELAKNNVERLTRLLTNILDLSKLESGFERFEFKRKHITSTISEALEMQRSLAEQKGLYLQPAFEQKLPAVMMDEDKIHQVLYNLINNAIKNTDAGGITVSAGYEPQSKQIRVGVTDTGAGISEADQAKLFQKFQKLSGSPRKTSDGTGLGLAICKQIIERHKGSIGLVSRPNKGSTFFFTLPAVE